MKFKKTIAAIAAAATLSGMAALPAVAATEERTGTVAATAIRYIKGWDGSAGTTYQLSGTTYTGLDIADKQGNANNTIYTANNATTGSGHDINVGFASFTLPADTEIKSATLKLTATHGQYTAKTTAYAAVADLSATVVTGGTAASTFESVTWANRPTLGATTKGVEYETGATGESYVAVSGKTLEIPLVDSNNALIVSKGETVTLAIYFAGKDARASFSSPVIEYTYDAPTTSGTLALGEVFAFKSTDTKPAVYRVGDHNMIYTDKGVTVTAGNNSEPTAYLSEEGIGTVTGTVFESLGDNTKVWRITNTDNSTNSKWNGSVEIKSAITAPGKYRISLLGQAKNRSFKITYGSNKSATTAAIGNSSTTATAVVTADVDVAAEDITDGAVTFKITGNSDCPNIYAIHIAKPTQGITAAAWNYSGSDNAYTVENTNELKDTAGNVVYGYSAEISDAGTFTTVKAEAAPTDTTKGAKVLTKNISGLTLENGGAIFYIVSSEKLDTAKSSITLE